MQVVHNMHPSQNTWFATSLISKTLKLRRRFQAISDGRVRGEHASASRVWATRLGRSGNESSHFCSSFSVWAFHSRVVTFDVKQIVVKHVMRCPRALVLDLLVQVRLVALTERTYDLISPTYKFSKFDPPINKMRRFVSRASLVFCHATHAA